MTDSRSLDGTWELFCGDHRLEDLDGLAPRPVRVPGLWEAQGLLELTGSLGTGAAFTSTIPAATGRCASGRSWTWPRCT
ncbi:MAG TPA: hypothetical protein VG673_13890 [Actinomycetota bacterium]|nr:hypothetical protein [Actinomycetota bacterium]